MTMRLGRTLKQLRHARGLTQAQVGARVGVTEAYISLLESGAKTNPSLQLLKRLAKVFRVTVGELAE